MAKSVVTTIIDDIDGSSDASTITFGLDGVAYSIDLGPKNEKKLRDALAPFVAHAARQRGGAATRGTTKRNDREFDIVALRAWAAREGVAVPQRGRIPGAVVDRYRAAGGR